MRPSTVARGALVRLGPRLQALAHAVLPGRPVADIGCDHALVSIHLVQTGGVPRAIATDVARPALSAAARSIELAELADRIDLRLGSGFDPLEPGEVATVVIAGVGAPLIASHLASAGPRLAGVERLVLHADDHFPRLGSLRTAIDQLGWGLVAETLVLDGERLHLILVAEPGGRRLADPIDRDLGPLLRSRTDPLFALWSAREQARVDRVLTGMAAGAPDPDRRTRFEWWRATLRGESPTWVVPPGSELVLTELLRLDAPGRAWSLLDWAARKTWIDARFRARGGELAIVRLLPPDQRPPVEHRQTERFTIALVRGPGLGLLAELEHRLREHESSFAWQRVQPADPRPPPRSPRRPAVVEPIVDPRDLDVEKLSLRAGIKPALRLLCGPTNMIWNAWLMHRQGYAMTLLPETLPGSRGDAVLMVAPTLVDTHAMAEAHLRELATTRRAAAIGTRELGRRLGYPKCCVAAFVADLEADVDGCPGGSGAEISRSSENWLHFTRAWVARPSARLNTLLFGERLRLISFDPCRFDCEHAAAIADAVFEVVAAEASEAAAALDRQLARAIAVDELDRRAWVTITQDEVVEVEPIRCDNSLPPDAGLAELLLGQRVDAAGRLPDLRSPDVRVFRFDHGN